MSRIRCSNMLLIFIAVVPNIATADFITIGTAGSKWGDRIHGTPSDVITWTFMNDNTVLAPVHPLIVNSQISASAGSNISGMRSTFDGTFGPGGFDQAINNAFNTWAAAAPGRITFQFVPTDTGAPAGDPADPASYAVDIRIGAFAPTTNSGVFGGAAAVGYGPPGDDLNFPDALPGDILFNINQPFVLAPGVEDDSIDMSGGNVNDLEGLVLHELGHAAIGLDHSTDGPNFPGLGDVMFVGAPANFINRQLSQQDIAGAQFVYGVPEPSAFGMALFCVVWTTQVRRRGQ